METQENGNPRTSNLAVSQHRGLTTVPFRPQFQQSVSELFSVSSSFGSPFEECWSPLYGYLVGFLDFNLLLETARVFRIVPRKGLKHLQSQQQRQLSVSFHTTPLPLFSWTPKGVYGGGLSLIKPLIRLHDFPPEDSIRRRLLTPGLGPAGPHGLARGGPGEPRRAVHEKKARVWGLWGAFWWIFKDLDSQVAIAFACKPPHLAPPWKAPNLAVLLFLLDVDGILCAASV